MSTEFIPGQNARAIRNTQSASGVEVVKNAEVAVEAYFGGSQFMARLEAEDGLIFSTDDFEPAPPPEPYTAPIVRVPGLNAPLDPTAVKAGDTATLRIQQLDNPVLTLSGETHTPHTGHGVYLGGWRLDDLPDYVTLIAHTPAPEPEPEWKPGTTGTATVRGVAGIRVFRLDPAPYEPGEHFAWATPDCRMGLPANEASWLLFEDDVTDFVPDEPRPLPTRDELAAALQGVPNVTTWDRSVGSGSLTTRSAGVLADAVVALLLRGESR